jgi:hypothetical protein
MAEHLITSFGENWTQVSRVAFVHVRRKPRLSLAHRVTDMDVLFFLLEYRGRSRAGVDGIALPPSAAWPAAGSRGQIRRTWWRPRVPTAQTKPSKWPPSRTPPPSVSGPGMPCAPRLWRRHVSLVNATASCEAGVARRAVFG